MKTLPIFRVARGLPPFAAEATVMASLLENAWNTYTGPFTEALLEEFQLEKTDISEERVKRIGDVFSEIRKVMVEETRPSIEKLVKIELSNAQAKFEREPDAAGQELRERFIKAQADQITQFLKDYPDRVIHPEIKRIIQFIEDNPHSASIDLATIQDRLERVTRGVDSWNDVGRVQAARIWSAESIFYAKEQGATDYMSVSMQDKDVCPVCLFLHGRIFKVDAAFKKLTKGMEETDPEKIAGTFPFPRFDDLDTRSYSDVKKDNHFPPYHPHCRCEAVPVFKAGAKPKSVSETASVPPGMVAEPPAEERIAEGYVKRKNMIAFEKQLPFKNVTEAKKWAEKNLAKKVPGLTKETLSKFNTAVEPLRTITKSAPLSEPLESFNLDFTKSGMEGEYSWLRKEISVDGSLNTKNRYGGLPQRQAYLEEIITLRKQTVTRLEGNITTTPQEEVKYIQLYKKAKTRAEKELVTFQKELENIDIAPTELPRTYDKGQYAIDIPSSDTHIGGVSVHEYGHAWHDSYIEEIGKYFKLQTNMMSDQYGLSVEGKFLRYRISGYSEMNFGELFAENFSAYMHGMVDIMHPDMIKFFDKMIPNMDFGHKLLPKIYEKEL